MEQWKEKCPIKRLRAYLSQEFGCTDAQMDALEKAAQEEMECAAQYAIQAPEPDPANVLQDVFYEGGDA